MKAVSASGSGQFSAQVQEKIAALQKSFVENLATRWAGIESAWQDFASLHSAAPDCVMATYSKPQRQEKLQHVYRLVHNLTGSGATFGFAMISDAARVVEKSIAALQEKQNHIKNIVDAIHASQRANEQHEKHEKHEKHENSDEYEETAQILERSQREISMIYDEISIHFKRLRGVVLSIHKAPSAYAQNPLSKSANDVEIPDENAGHEEAEIEEIENEEEVEIEDIFSDTPTVTKEYDVYAALHTNEQETNHNSYNSSEYFYQGAYKNTLETQDTQAKARLYPIVWLFSGEQGNPHLAAQMQNSGMQVFSLSNNDVTALESVLISGFRSALLDGTRSDILSLSMQLPAAALVDVDIYPCAHLPSLVAHLQSHGVPVFGFGTKNDFDIRLQSVRADLSSYIPIPIDTAGLLNHLASAVHLDWQTPPRLVLVDDDALLLDLYREVLMSAGMQVRTASSAAQAIALLDESVPDLLIVDLHMPFCSGRELAAIVRQEQRYLGLPIVFLSIENDADARLSAMNAGADDFLSKNVSAGRLLAAVRHRVARAKQLRAQMLHDGLTGVLNEYACKESLQREVARAYARREPLAVALLEVDHFKRINETHSYLRGDLVLQSLTRLVQDAAQNVDIVGKYGNDAIVWAMPVTNKDEALQKAQVIQEQFAAQRYETRHHGQSEKQKKQISCTCSVSVIEVGTRNTSRSHQHHQKTHRGADVEAILQAADNALYQSRRQPRTRLSMSLSMSYDVNADDADVFASVFDAMDERAKDINDG